ncbi:cation diffusion facilitator family transporter [Leptolinea tardivitalis]|uniref:Cation transporter n=1 Tax=Leptolinea tardivitalis TaxID=229920 RepID=A0A0P6XPG7_9CHLR|nr:cation diffusion facilitator family transporter [Leptolinea tardivitalis]KPL71033.1 cation transporter [Leptolinea tardivitalis]GAP22436.1 cation diffusion facilitator family transporter [Leptolinea tardivitalis]
MEGSSSSQATREKTQAALSSVIAAVGLTTFKIIVGAVTGSLGILAEAAHSGLDLVAALVTFLAVRISGKPADEEHLYGHGKVENLSALFETLLLLATCAWIIYEAYQRLFVHPVEVEVSIWAFIVMAVSIIVDATRSRVLANAAKKHNSQALEADALHFSTDIWSSSVVIAGLGCVLLANNVKGLDFLKHADAVAAVGVAFIVIYVSVELGIRTIKGLLDSAPDGLVEKVTAVVKSVPGVSDVHKVRVRPSGAHIFIDAHVVMDAALPLGEVHTLTEKIQAEVRKIAPEADFTVHAEPPKKVEEPKVEPPKESAG